MVAKKPFQSPPYSHSIWNKGGAVPLKQFTTPEIRIFKRGLSRTVLNCFGSLQAVLRGSVLFQTVWIVSDCFWLFQDVAGYLGPLRTILNRFGQRNWHVWHVNGWSMLCQQDSKTDPSLWHETPIEVCFSPTAWIEPPSPCFGLSRHQSRRYQTILDHFQPFRVFLNDYGTILNHSGPFCTIWDYSRIFWTILAPFCIISDHFGPH
jgi:hypothetical protein